MNRDKLRSMLILDEGVRLKPYLDTMNKISIGVGRNLTDEGINPDEMELMLSNDITKHVASLDHHLSWWRTLDEVRQLILADMCYNMGIDGLLGFVHMLEHLRAGRFGQAADHMAQSKWAAQTKSRAQRLIMMMRTGEELKS